MEDTIKAYLKILKDCEIQTDAKATDVSEQNRHLKLQQKTKLETRL